MSWGRTTVTRDRQGLGDAATTQKIVLSAPQIAGGVLTAGGTSSIAAGLWGAAAVPVIGAAVVGVTLALMLIFSRKGPKQKVATTQIVDAVEPELKKNIDAYFAGPRTLSSQAQALQNFDAGWQYVLENCGIPEMGEPGQRCISERGPGGRFPWFAWYRDPIANDALVKEDPLIPELSEFNLEQIFQSSETVGFPMLPAILGGVLIVAAFLGGGE